MPGPPSVEVAARHVRTGDDWSATLAVTGYPAEVSAGWLEPLLSYPGRVDVTLHIEPIPVAVAAARLRRQRARLESGRRAGIDRGQLDDPDTEAAADDARDLAYRLARGEGKLFRLGLYLTVHAGSEEDLAAEVQAVRALAASLLLVTVPATFRSLQGWATTLPAGTDQLLLRRTMDTAALAASPSRSPPRTCPATPPPRTRCPACCTGSTPPGRGWWPGTGGRPTTTTPSPSPPPARASPTWPSWRSSGQPVRGHRVLGDRPRGRVRPARRSGGRRVHPPGRAGRAPEPVRPARRRAGQGGHPDPPRPVHPHRRRGAVRRRAVPGRAGGAGQGDHDRLPAGRDHRRPPDLGAARPAAARPRDRAARREDAGRDRAGRPARPVHRGQPLRPVRAPTTTRPEGTWSSSASATSPTSCARPRPCSPWIPPGGRSPTPPGAGGG